MEVKKIIYTIDIPGGEMIITLPVTCERCGRVYQEDTNYIKFAWAHEPSLSLYCIACDPDAQVSSGVRLTNKTWTE